MQDSGVSWLGEVPSHWEIAPLKRAYTRVKRTAKDDAGIVTAFRDGQVTLRSNRRSDGYTEADDYSGYQGIAPGDLAIHSMDGFAGAIGVSDSQGMCSPVLSVCTAQGENDPRYMAYQLRLMSARGWIEALSRSVRERTSEFRWAEAGNQKIALPPVEEQKAIADFLDREVGRIERLVSKNDELVELAEQRHRSVISEALAVGLNPRAPLKESSLPWASKCPAHWDVKPLWAVAKQNKRSNKGMIEDNLLSLSYGRIVRRDIEAVDGLLPESFETYQVVLPGDVIFRLTDLQNDQKSLRSGVVLERGIITSAYLSIELSELLDPGFFGALMRSYDLRKVFYGMGSGLRQSLNWDEFKGMSVLVPSLEEQIQISKHLELLDAKHQKLKLRLKNLNMTLAQRKAALVDAAVTGKIKVREI